MRHKMAHLPVVPSAVARATTDGATSPRGATSTAVHTSSPLVASVRLVQLIHKSRHMDYHDLKVPDLEKTFRRVLFSNND
jgi:hypothetical protein